MPNPSDQSRTSSSRGSGALVPSDQSAFPFVLDQPEQKPAGLSVTAPAPANRGMSVWDVLRYKWTMTMVALPVMVALIAAIWTLIEPKYLARAEIRVKPIIPHLVFRTEDSGLIPMYQSYLNTQVSVIRNPTVLQRVLDQPAVQKTEWYTDPSPPLGPGKLNLEVLRDELEVTPRGRTELIDVSVLSRNARDAVVIVNAVIDEYVRYVHEQAEQSDDRLFTQLTNEYNTYKTKIAGGERVIEDYRKQLGTGDPEELITQKRVRLDAAEAELREHRRKIVSMQWQLQQLEEMLEVRRRPATQPAEKRPEVALSYQDDPEWRRLSNAVKAAEHEVEVYGLRLGSRHPKMEEARRAVELAKRNLREREEQLETALTAPEEAIGPSAPGRSVSLAARVEDARQRLGLLKQEEQLLEANLNTEREEFNRIFSMAGDLAKEQEKVAHDREMYEAVRTRLSQKAMERNVPGSISVLSRAMSPSEPYKDRRLLLSVFAIMAGLGSGVGVAFLRAAASQSIQTAMDVPRAVSAPFLGQLPLLGEGDRHGVDEVALQAEFLRMARTALLERLGGASGRAILITSAGAGSGKTTVATLLSKSLAQCGRRVLLVDADLRRPAVGYRLGIQGGPGLVGALRGTSTDEECIIATDNQRLNVLPGGGHRGGSEPELLANGTFAQCMERWRSCYDIIVLDSPPVLPVADARILARNVDGAVMVVREGHCRRADVVDALAHLATAGTTLLGTIFIGSLPRSRYPADYYGYYATETSSQASQVR